MKYLKIQSPFSHNHPELIQEYYRERFYGGITLIAVNTTMLLSDTLISTSEAIITVIVTILSLWLAGILSTLLSYRVMSVSSKKHKKKVFTTFKSHRGILYSAIPCLLCISLSSLSLIDLSTALVGAIVLSITRIIFTVVTAYDNNRHYFAIIFASISIQICILSIIVALKFIGGK